MSISTELNEIGDIKTRMKAEMIDKWAIGRYKGNQARGFINSKILLIYLTIALLLLYFVSNKK